MYMYSCKEHKGQATKKLDLWSVPDVLVVHLKRFHSAYEKVTDFVDFPLTGLDLEGQVRGPETLRKLAEKHPENSVYRDGIDNESLVYDLFGVVNHFGGVGGGHYTAYAVNGDNGMWYNFDDVRFTGLSLRLCEQRETLFNVSMFFILHRTEHGHCCK